MQRVALSWNEFARAMVVRDPTFAERVAGFEAVHGLLNDRGLAVTSFAESDPQGVGAMATSENLQAAFAGERQANRTGDFSMHLPGAAGQVALT